MDLSKPNNEAPVRALFNSVAIHGVLPFLPSGPADPTVRIDGSNDGLLLSKLARADAPA